MTEKMEVVQPFPRMECRDTRGAFTRLQLESYAAVITAVSNTDFWLKAEHRGDFRQTKFQREAVTCQTV